MSLGDGLVTLFLQDGLFDVVDLVLDHELFVFVVFVGNFLVEASSGLGPFAESGPPGRQDVELGGFSDCFILADLDIAVVEGLDGIGPLVHFVFTLGADGGQHLFGGQVVHSLDDGSQVLLHLCRGHQLETLQVSELSWLVGGFQVGDVDVLDQAVHLFFVEEGQGLFVEDSEGGLGIDDRGSRHGEA